MGCVMEEKSSITLENILQAAMEEFSDKGFLGASLRQIVKKAGVTTGAFYGYFSSKEALFTAIVEPHAAALMGKIYGGSDLIRRAARRTAAGPHGRGVIGLRPLDGGLHLPHREPVKLLLCRSEGTSYEHFVHNMVEVEVEYTIKYMEVLRRLGRDIPELDAQMCHIIASGMFNGIFEIVVHDMPRDRALRYVDQLRDFYTAGWLKLMGQ